jgi:hypothetical protein
MKFWSESYGDYILRFFVVFFTLYFYTFQFLMKPSRIYNVFNRIFIKRLPLTNFESVIFNVCKLSQKKEINSKAGTYET